MSDVDWLARTASRRLHHEDSDREENAILYGNRDSNRAWDVLLHGFPPMPNVNLDTPIVVSRDSLRMGTWVEEGDSLGAVFVRPHPFGKGVVGVIAGTGIRGTRLGYTLPYFTSGVGYPDYAVFSSEVLAKGDGGVLNAGWFAHDWSYPGLRPETK